MPKKTKHSSPAAAERSLPPPSLTPLQTAGAAAVLAVAVVLAYSNALTTPFIFDDAYHIVDNATIRTLWPPWDALFAKPNTTRPVVGLTLALNYATSGLDVWSYHLVNIAVHILAALVAFGIVRRTLLTVPLAARFADVATPLGLGVALLWAVHPVQTQAVTYVIQRAESLMGLFYLLSLYCVIRGATAAAYARRWYGGAIAACALGMGCKQVMITAPLVILVYDGLFLSPSYGRAWERRWPLYLGLASTAIIPFGLLAMAPTDRSAGFTGAAVAPWEYALSQFGVIAHYLRLSFLPVGQCLDYVWPVARSVREILPGLLAVGGLGVASMAALWQRRRPLGFLGAWFFLILAPTSTIVPIADLAVEHRLYLSLLAVSALAVIGGVAGIQIGLRRVDVARKSRGRWLLAASTTWIAVLAVILASLSFQRNRVYVSAISVWQDVVAKRPGNWRGYNNLGQAYMSAGDVVAARGHFETALALKPDYGDAHHNMGLVLEKQGRTQEALVHYNEALRLRPGHADARANLGVALVSAGNLKEAAVHFERALKVNPRDAKARVRYGGVLVQMGRFAEAEAHLTEALKRDGTSAAAHSNLGLALWNQGKREPALTHYREALRIDPDSASAHNNLGSALFALGRGKEAAEHLGASVRLQPDDAQSRNNLGYVLFKEGRLAEGETHLREAVRIKPDYPEARLHLGYVLQERRKSQEAMERYREVMQMKPLWPQSYHRLAWILATHPSSTLRDGKTAVQLGEKAVQLAGQPESLDALAAAYAETGRFAEAVQVAQKALELASSSGEPDLAAGIRDRLALYKVNRPFHQ